MEYTPRKRVTDILNHKEPDRVPLVLSGRNSSMMQGSYRALKKYLGLDDSEYEIIDQDWFVVVEFDERLLQFLEIDFRLVYPGFGGYKSKKIRKKGETWVDEFGFLRKYTGIYGEMIDHSIRHAKDPEDIIKFKFPDPYDLATEGLRERVEYLYNSTNYSIVGSVGTKGLYETGNWMRGFDQWPIDLLLNKKIAHTLLDKLNNWNLEMLDAFLNVAGPYIQIMEMSDDFAHTDGLCLSPELFIEMILPYYKREIDLIKSKTNASISHHICGSAIPAVPLLLEAGIDILNPLQPRSNGMDTTCLKDEFGNRISFHGGVDVQKVLPLGTSEDVEKEVKRRIAIYGPGGGIYVGGSTLLTR